MSIGVGVGKGAGAGILIKSAEALERMEWIDTLVVDKTGTLTGGKPTVVQVVAASDQGEARLLASPPCWTGRANIRSPAPSLPQPKPPARQSPKHRTLHP